MKNIIGRDRGGIITMIISVIVTALIGVAQEAVTPRQYIIPRRSEIQLARKRVPGICEIGSEFTEMGLGIVSGRGRI